MKLSGYWICCVSILVLLFCSGFVLADEIDPTITHVFFEMDGRPFNDSVHFTVECYGYAWKMWDGSAPEDRIAKVNHTSELVYSYSASCPSYGCTIYEPYYHAERLYVDRCDVRGQAAGTDFTIRNFSLSPLPYCTELRPFVFRNRGPDRNWTYFNGTPEYDACVNATRLEREGCDQFVAICNPKTDPECGGRSIGDNTVKETPAYRTCVDRISEKRTACDAKLQPVDPATIVMWTDTDGSESPARRACELRVTLPPGTRATESLVPAEQSAHTIFPQNEGSIWCRILSLVGRECQA